MNSDDEDIDLWSRRLAGRVDGDDRHSDAEMMAALRAAIQRDNKSINDTVDETERARFLKRLEREGVFAEQNKSVNRRFQSWIAVAASFLLVVSIGTWQFFQPVEDVYRGVVGSVVIVSERPAIKLEEVMQQLRGIGLEPRQVENAERLSIEVTVAPEQLDAFYQWAAHYNARAVAAGVYRIYLDEMPK